MSCRVGPQTLSKSPERRPQNPACTRLQDWHFSGSDILYIIRSSYRGANSYHNSNRILYARLKRWQQYVTPQIGAAPVATRAAELAPMPTSSPDAAAPQEPIPEADNFTELQDSNLPRHGICDGRVLLLPCGSAGAEGAHGGAHGLLGAAGEQKGGALPRAISKISAWIWHPRWRWLHPGAIRGLGI